MRASFLFGAFFIIHFVSFNLLVAEDSTPIQDGKAFLESARKAPMNESWAVLSGRIIHKRGKASPVESPVYLGILFTPERILAQIYIDPDEKYSIGQAYYSKNEDGTSVIPFNNKKDGQSVLAECGLRPEDMTFSFMYWDFVKELDANSSPGRQCRVFLLESPSKKEQARVYIDTEYRYPLKAEWIKSSADGKKEEPYRSIEIGGFRKEAGFWFVESFQIFGPGFRTKVEFSDVKAGLSKDGIPENLLNKQ